MIKNISRRINLDVDKTPEELKHLNIKKKEEKEHRNRLMQTLLLKKIKMLKLEDGLLQKQKILVEPLRLRHKLDDLRYLHSQKEVPCYLEQRGNFEPVHFVVHQLQAKRIRRLKDLHTRPIYLKLGNEEIRCLIKEFSFSQHLHYYFRIVFKRYIPGEPNETKVKLFFDDMAHFHMMDKQIKYHHPEIQVISYNDVNPTSIKLDIYRLLRKQKYTFGDVQNILPPGLELHPKYNKMLNATVAIYDTYLSKKVQDIKWFDLKDQRYYTQLSGDDQDLDSYLYQDNFDNLSGKQKIKKKEKKAPPKQKMGSLKKQLKSEQERLRKLLEEEQMNV